MLATSEKIGTASPYTVIPMHEATAVDHRVVDTRRQVRALRRKGVELIHAR